MNNFAFFHEMGLKYPLIQGGMAWVSDSKLAAAVSNAGGLGVIAAGNAPPDYVRAEIREVKSLTSKPFGVNIMLLSPFAQEITEMVCEEGVKVITTGAGSPGKYIKKWKEHGIKIIPVVPSVALARRMEKEGVDAVIAEGGESGGHVGELSSMALWPQVVDAVRIPVVAAGGIGDGRGIAAAFMLGASGVQLGTRFVVSEECTVHDNYKMRVLKAKDTDTVVTGRPTGHPVRILKNKLSRQFEDLERRCAAVEEYEALGAGALRKAVQDGDIDYGSVMSGQIAGLMKEIKPCRQIIEDLFSQAEKCLGKFDFSKVMA